MKAARVLFFINQNQTVLMANQSAFGQDLMGVWDYHVVLFLVCQEKIIDFDTKLGFQSDVRIYGTQSFPHARMLSREARVRLGTTNVRSIDAIDYLDYFWSDRKHMIDQLGNQVAPFPDWQPILAREKPLRLTDLKSPDFRDQRVQDHSLETFMAGIGCFH